MAARPISLRWLVPAISAVFLAAVVTVFGTIAYRSVRSSTLAGAAERLTTVVQVFAQPPAAPQPWIRELQAVALRPEVLEIIRSNGQRVSDSARAQIASLTPDTGQTLATDIRSANGTVLFAIARADTTASGSPTRAIARPQGDSADLDPRLLAWPTRLTQSYPDTVVLSQLYMSGADVVIERGVPIHDDGRLVGHVIQVRKLAPNPDTRRRLSTLIGKDAAIVVGNRDGSVWSDLEKAVSHPPASNEPQTYERDGRRWISATGPSPNGPWTIGIEFPEDIVLAPVEALRWRLFVIGAIIVVLAVLLAERLSRRLTVPLQGLTSAAEELAAGNRTPVVATLRTDEIGRLSRAFDAMAHSIRTSQDTLEYQIGERTQELEAALARLKAAQDELVRQERLATLGHLSGSIAHELRNPLGVMMNAVFYLESVLGDAPPRVREHLTKLRNQVGLSASIITGLLDFTRTGQPQLSTVTVQQLLDEHLARVTVPASISVNRDISPNVPPVRVDAVQVGQILVNLFTNALQAMEGGPGVLTVRARRHGDNVRIEVSDTGPGIPTEERDRIFEPLYTTKARGIGLGLSISRSLARVNDGELTVVAQSDSGATLALDLPAAVGQPAQVAS